MNRTDDWSATAIVDRVATKNEDLTPKGAIRIVGATIRISMSTTTTARDFEEKAGGRWDRIVLEADLAVPPRRGFEDLLSTNRNGKSGRKRR